MHAHEKSAWIVFARRGVRDGAEETLRQTFRRVGAEPIRAALDNEGDARDAA